MIAFQSRRALFNRAAAVVTFTALCFALFSGWAAPSASAGTLTITFGGQVVQTFGSPTPDPALGTPVTGTMTITNLDPTPTGTFDYSGINAFVNDFQGNGSWSIQFGAGPAITGSGSGGVNSYSQGDFQGPNDFTAANATFDISSYGAFGDPALTLSFANANAPGGAADYHDLLLTLISDLPTDLTAASAFLHGFNTVYGPGNTLASFPVGALDLNTGSGKLIYFQISAFSASYQTAVTPVPAALPLFATALGGLGVLRWRRRKPQAAA
jgi:hypothetical protein